MTCFRPRAGEQELAQVGGEDADRPPRPTLLEQEPRSVSIEGQQALVAVLDGARHLAPPRAAVSQEHPGQEGGSLRLGRGHRMERVASPRRGARPGSDAKHLAPLLRCEVVPELGALGLLARDDPRAPGMPRSANRVRLAVGRPCRRSPVGQDVRAPARALSAVSISVLGTEERSAAASGSSAGSCTHSMSASGSDFLLGVMARVRRLGR